MNLLSAVTQKVEASHGLGKFAKRGLQIVSPRGG